MLLQMLCLLELACAEWMKQLFIYLNHWHGLCLYPPVGLKYVDLFHISRTKPGLKPTNAQSWNLWLVNELYGTSF